MSIAPAVGALTDTLTVFAAHGYHRFGTKLKKRYSPFRLWVSICNAAKTVKDFMAAAVLPGACDELGFKYIGYVDGHNPRALVAAHGTTDQDGPVAFMH
jgi:deoxyxylulose-5-phosphate synthase